MSQKSAYISVFALMIVLTKFFDFVLLSHRYLTDGCILIFAYFFINTKKDEERNKGLIGAVTLLVIASCLYSKVVHQQSLHAVIIVSYFAFGLLFFCVPLHYNLSYRDSIRLIKNFSILFCICYIIQWTLYPTIIFAGALDEFSINVDQFRMRMTCSLCSYCLFLYGMSHLFVKKKPIYLFYTILGFIPAIMMGFRSLLALLGLSAVYLFVVLSAKNLGRLFFNSIMALIILIGFLQVPLVQNKIEEMMERQESNQTFDNDDYVRYASFAFYVTDIYTDPWERIVGGGVPLVSLKDKENVTKYARDIASGYANGLYWNDLGLIGLALVIGSFTTLLIIFLMLRTCIMCNVKELLFIRCTILVGLIGSIFTSQEIYRAGNFIFVALLMYTDYRYRFENKIV